MHVIGLTSGRAPLVCQPERSTAVFLTTDALREARSATGIRASGSPFKARRLSGCGVCLAKRLTDEEKARHYFLDALTAIHGKTTR